MPEDAADESHFSSRTIGGRSVDTSTWATPDEGALAGTVRARYFARKSAVALYLAGADEDEILKKSGIGAKQTYRLVRERCLQVHPDGQPYGWRALVPYLRIKPYERHRPIRVSPFGTGAAGVFTAMLDRHPDLRKKLDHRILREASPDKLSEIKITRKNHWRWFKDQLRALGYELRGEWPFSRDSEKYGYSSICRYVNKILSKNPRKLAIESGGPELARKLKTGDGTNRPVFRFMQRIEMDAHKTDGRFCVSIPLLDGESKEIIVHRLWVIVLQEVVTRAVLGYYFSMNREVSADDVRRAIKCALSRWVAKPVCFSDAPYEPGAGLLSSVGPEFVRLCWDETSVDGALAETCKIIRDILSQCVGSTLLTPETSFARRRSPDDRPNIEAFFRNLAGGGFQRMSNTTGGKPEDRKGRKPEQVALASRFQIEYAQELLDVMIANYNRRPCASIGGRSPLNYAKFLFENSNKNYKYTSESTIESLFSFRKLCPVKGGAKEGRKPYVNFCRGRYSNDILAGMNDLVGKRIWVVWHKEDDGRVALATMQNGVALGVLRAAPPWNISPHNQAVRSAICRLVDNEKFNLPEGSDAITKFIEYAESRPHGKLPIHPAYLEARIILTEAAEEFVGESMLESALLRAKEIKEPLRKTEENKSDSGKSSPLPPRRMSSGN